jgi:dihydroorotate dehydrogenase electron transfer subunit
MREFEAGIIRTEHRGQSYRRIELDCPDIARIAAPGQFVQVRACGGSDPFLRRTFSLCGSDPERGILSLLIDVVGVGTRIIAETGRGRTLDLIGPLGRGFDLFPGRKEHWVLVAGGVGAAPLLFLGSRLAGDAAKRVTFLMGARTRAHHTLIDRMLPESVRVLRATDDGSLGFRGYVSDLLDAEFDALAPDVIAACGPNSMMEITARIASARGVRCMVSLEERCACGIGACLGCAVKLADGRMARSCAEGPVFDAEALAW